MGRSPRDGSGGGDADKSGTGGPEPDDASRTWKDAWPFFVAFGVVVIAAAGIGVSYLIRPAEDRMSDTARVQHAINDQYTARNDLDYAKYRGVTCQADLVGPDFPTEAAFLDANRASNDENGHIVIPEIREIHIDGTRATADVEWHFDNKPDEKQLTHAVVVSEDGNWKVCTS